MSKFKVGDKVILKENRYAKDFVREIKSVEFRKEGDLQAYFYDLGGFNLMHEDDLELYKTPHERLIELGWVALNETSRTLTYLLNVDGSLHPERIELSHEGKSFYTTLRVVSLELAEILVDCLKELRDE